MRKDNCLILLACGCASRCPPDPVVGLVKCSGTINRYAFCTGTDCLLLIVAPDVAAYAVSRRKATSQSLLSIAVPVPSYAEGSNSGQCEPCRHVLTWTRAHGYQPRTHSRACSAERLPRCSLTRKQFRVSHNTKQVIACSCAVCRSGSSRHDRILAQVTSFKTQLFCFKM
jgi:hypothetical protein